MTHEELELATLKHFISNPRALNLAQEMGVVDEYFWFTPEDAEGCYHQSIFRLMDQYYSDSGGSLLTERVLEHKLLERGANERQRSTFMLLWSKIEEQEYDENELYSFLEQLKTKLCMRIWSETHSKSLEKMTNEGLPETIDFMQEQLDKINDILLDINKQKQSIDITESAEYFKSEYQHRKDNPDDYMGCYCGLPEIDQKTFGFRPPQMVVVLAPSSGGKSVQLLNWAVYANTFANKKVLYFSFEMDLWQCYMRHISLVLDIPYNLLKSANLSEADLETAMQKLQTYSGKAYFEYDVNMEDPTPEYVESRIREMIRTKGKPDYIVIDYIGNMQVRNARSGQKPWEQQGDAFVKLFKIGKKYHHVTLTAQQVNRETIRESRQAKAKNKTKTIEYAQDAASGDQRLMHYAHYVFGLDPHKEESMVTYLPVKMRDAWFVPFSAKWNSEYNRIEPLSEEEQAEWRNNLGGIDGASEVAPRIVHTGESIISEWAGSTENFDESELVLDASDFGTL